MSQLVQRKTVQSLTETQYNTVKTPLDASVVLESEAMTAEQSGDTSTATTKRNEATTKIQRSKNCSTCIIKLNENLLFYGGSSSCRKHLIEKYY